MASAKGTPTPTPTLRPRFELEPPLLLVLSTAAALPNDFVSLVENEDLGMEPTLTADSYGYC